MKKFFVFLLLATYAMCGKAQYTNPDQYTIWRGRMSVGTNSAANTSTLLQVGDSGFKSMLLPRVIGTNNVVAPVKGMFHYDLTTNKVYVRGLTSWVPLADSNGLATKINDVYKRGDSVFTQKNGVETYAFSAKTTLSDGEVAGITRSMVFDNVAQLRASTLMDNGVTKAFTRGYSTVNDGGGSQYIWNPAAGGADDGQFIFLPNTYSSGMWGRWEWQAKGTVRASEVGVLSNGADQSATLNALFALSSVKEVLFDNGAVTINGTVDFKKKKVTFENGAKLTGTGLIKNILPSADYKTQIFDVALNTTASIIAPKVSVMWWGAAPQADYDTGNGIDNYNAFNRAIASQKLQTSVYIPGADTTKGHLGFYYYCSRPIIITSRIELFGDGQDKSIVLIPGDSTGLWLKWGSSGSNLHDFAMVGNYGSAPSGFNSNTAHGIWVQSNTNVIERVSVSLFSGDGIRIQGDVGGTPYTNANNNKVKNVFVSYNGRAGMYFQGGDANNCSVESIDATGNAQVNIWDNSFLGNYFYACHTASAAIDNPRQQSCVSHGGLFYLAIYNSVGIEPGVTSGWENYWRMVSPFFPPFSLAWNDTTQYYLTAGYYAQDPNQLGLFDACYAEGDQNTTINKGNSLFINGYAAGYGQAPGTLGMRLGFLTSPNFQVMYGGTTSALRLTSSLTPTLTWEQGSNYPIGLTGAAEGGYITTTWANGIAGSGSCIFASPSWGGWPSWMGRDRGIQGNAVRFLQMYGTPIGYYNSYSTFREISFGSSAPTSGDFGVGDVVINDNAGSPTLMWQCSVASIAGNGGTWVPILKGGGGSLPQFHLSVGNSSNVAADGGSNITFDGTTFSLNGSIAGTTQGKILSVSDNTTTDYTNLGFFNSSVATARAGFQLTNNSSGDWANNYLLVAQTGASHTHNNYFTNIPSKTTDAGYSLLINGGSQTAGMLVGTGGNTPLYFGINNTATAAVTSSGFKIGQKTYIGNISTTPTALLHLGAGTASANTAPLKLTSGVNLTTPEDGAVEYDGTHFYGTVGSTRYQLDQQSGGTPTGWNQWNVATAQTSDATATTVVSITCPSDASGTLVVEMVSTKTDNTKSLEGRKTIHWHSSGGTVTVDHTVSDIPDYLRSFTTATWTVDASGDSLRIRATGEASTTVDWTPTYKLKYNSYAF